MLKQHSNSHTGEEGGTLLYAGPVSDFKSLFKCGWEGSAKVLFPLHGDGRFKKHLASKHYTQERVEIKVIYIERQIPDEDSKYLSYENRIMLPLQYVEDGQRVGRCNFLALCEVNPDGTETIIAIVVNTIFQRISTIRPLPKRGETKTVSISGATIRIRSATDDDGPEFHDPRMAELFPKTPMVFVEYSEITSKMGIGWSNVGCDVLEKEILDMKLEVLRRRLRVDDLEGDITSFYPLGRLISSDEPEIIRQFQEFKRDNADRPSPIVLNQWQSAHEQSLYKRLARVKKKAAKDRSQKHVEGRENRGYQMTVGEVLDRIQDMGFKTDDDDTHFLTDDPEILEVFQEFKRDNADRPSPILLNQSESASAHEQSLYKRLARVKKKAAKDRSQKHVEGRENRGYQMTVGEVLDRIQDMGFKTDDDDTHFLTDDPEILEVFQEFKRDNADRPSPILLNQSESASAHEQSLYKRLARVKKKAAKDRSQKHVEGRERRGYQMTVGEVLDRIQDMGFKIN